MRGLRRITLAALVVALAGCSTGQTLVTSEPTPTQVASVQREALRAVEGLRTGLLITQRLGADLPQLGLPPAYATRVDCAILKVTGTSTPASPTVVAACGPVPLASAAPVAVALTALQTVSTCPGLESTLHAVTPAVYPLLDVLDSSGMAAVRMIGASLRLAFAILAPGGIAC